MMKQINKEHLVLALMRQYYKEQRVLTLMRQYYKETSDIATNETI